MALHGNRFTLGLLLLAVITLAGCDRRQQDYPARTMPAELADDAAAIERGRQLFLAKCASCHGKPDEGRSARAGSFQPPATDFTQREYRQIEPAYLFWRIQVGKTVEPYRSQGSVMPAWGAHLSDRQIWQLVAYLIERAA